MMRPSQLAPYPPSYALQPGYPRHAPSVRQTAEAMWSLALAQPWPDLDWPELIEALISLGRTDIPLSRLVEGHIDALRILKEADHPAVPDSLYAVWASRSHATGISARPTEAGWRLSGILRFASGVGVVDRALVPVWLDADTHLLLDLDVGCWPADESAWQTSAMAVSRSHTVTLDDLPAPGSSRIGDTDGAPPAASRSVRLGQVRTELSTAHAVLSRAASVLIGQSGSRLDADGLRTLATETRAAVAAAVHRVLELARTVAGPAGLAYAAELTHAVDDLNLYVRQQNADADFTYLGDAP